MIHFDRLGLSTGILRAVTDQGYSEPTPIQAKAIPVVLQGKDLLAGAQTGTGKTAGFTLPMLQRLSASGPFKGRRPIRGLVLTPTRELAAQVGESIKVYGKNLPLRSTVIFGGVNIKPQIQTLRNGVDILVATPGRLLDHLGQRTLDLSRVEILVLDEADRMLDMGFIHDIKKVLAFLPPKRQNLLFSATFSNEIKQLANRLLKPSGFRGCGAPQCHGGGDCPKGVPRGPGAQTGAAVQAHHQGPMAPGTGFYAYQTRCQPAGQTIGSRRY